MTSTPVVAAPARPTTRPSRPTAWWGMVGMIATEAVLFAGLLSSYFFVRAASPGWPQGGIARPELGLVVPFTAVLLASSIPLFVADAAARRGHWPLVRAMLALSFTLGAAFLGRQVVEYRALGFGIRDNAYASLFYVITGLHGLHVAFGLAVSVVVQAKAWTGRLTAERHLTLTVFSLYWHFVDVVWVFVFASLYLSVRW